MMKFGKKRKLLMMVCAAMLVVSMGLAGCAPTDTGGGEEAATTDTEASAPSDESPADSPNAEEDTSATAGNELFPEVTIGPAEGKTEDDYKFGLVYGGVNPYFDPMQPAADLMAEILQIPKLTVDTPEDWDQNEQNQILDGQVAQGMKGFVTFPSNAVAANAEYKKIVDAGMPVVCVGGAPEDPSPATLTLATDVYKSSYEATETLIKEIGEKGNIVALSGDVSDPNTVKRFQAADDVVEKYPDVKLLQKIGDIDDAEGSMTAVESLLTASGDEIAGIVSTAYFPSVAMATYLPDYPDIKGVAIDTDEKVLQAVRDGVLIGTMSQNPYGQAYIGTLTCKMLVDGWTYKEGEDVLLDSGSFLVTADNIDDYDGMKVETTNEILKTWVSKFNPPAGS